MPGLGTIINTAAIVAGGLFGFLFGKLIKERHQETIMKTCGISVIVLGIGGTLSKMFVIEDGSLTCEKSVLMVLCLTVGALIGECFNIEDWFERFGEWLKIKTGNAKDKTFVDAFVTASLTVCIGAMAVIGSIEDGINHDPTILITKAILDGIIIMVMTPALGKGAVFSAIPVAVIQGLITAGAQLIKPLMTDPALANLSLVGNVLIACIGINLLFGKQIRAANLLPSIFLAIGAAFLPF